MPDQPTHISVRGARVHNLKDVDVDIPLGEFVGIAGVSGSGKSSLALGVLYAEGSRRYLDALSTYTRRRISQSTRAAVDKVEHVPAALALRQRPGIPDVRSTFGTSTELLNYLRLAFSRLGSHRCPNGHATPPTMNVALEREIECPTCGARFYGPGAEAMAFNSEGACPTCAGTGLHRTVDVTTLVPDESKTIDEGAVVVWGSLMWSLMKDVCREMGVRTDVPFNELTPEERDIVYSGPAEKKHLLYHNEKTGIAGEMDFTYYSAIYTVENALSKVKDEKGLKRVAKFLKEAPCPDCAGTRLSAKVRSTTLCGINLAQATAFTLDELAAWIPTVAPSLPEEMRPMAESILAGMAEPVERLQQLGLGYLSLDRASSTLSTGELQRVQLTRAVRNRTTGVLYVLDEPSIGLHPSNVDGLLGVVDDLIADGNSVLIVDHDVRVLRTCDHLIEIGPESGTKGGTVIAQGSVEEVAACPDSRIAGFLTGKLRVQRNKPDSQDDLFAQGGIYLRTGAIHTVKPLEVHFPRGRLTAVTGVSGSGKTTVVLESLIPGLQAAIAGARLPQHVVDVDAGDLRRVNLIDASPIGVNVRSTVATYSGVLDDLRRAYATAPAAKERGLEAIDATRAELDALEQREGERRAADTEYMTRLESKLRIAQGMGPMTDKEADTARLKVLFAEFAGDPLAVSVIRHTLGGEKSFFFLPDDDTGKRQKHLETAVKTLFEKAMRQAGCDPASFNVNPESRAAECDAFCAYALAQDAHFSMDDREVWNATTAKLREEGKPDAPAFAMAVMGLR